MSNYKLARRYAKGLLRLAIENEKQEEISAEVIQLTNLLDESEDLVSFFNSPIIGKEKKQEVVAEVFKSFSQPVRKFVEVIVDHGRESNIKVILSEYTVMAKEEQGINKVIITSVSPLSDAQQQKIIAESKEKFNLTTSKYDIVNKIDESLIGGFILRIGDIQLDASVKTKLTNLKKEFDVNHYTAKF